LVSLRLRSKIKFATKEAKVQKISNTVNNQLLENLEFYTKLSQDQRKTHIQWFSRQNIEFQILLFKEQRNQYFKLKNLNADQDVLQLAAFYLAIKHFYEKEKLLKSKNKSQSLEEIGNLSNIELVKMKKQKLKLKQEMLLNMHSVIEQLFNNSYSLREIESILKNKYRKDVSHTYVGKYINDHIVNKDRKNV
jgi:uncharacterized protein YdcH (DUF465 family)